MVVNLGDGVGFEMAIVGESYYGLEIKTIAGNRLARGEEVVFTVTLQREPDNEYDANAVAVIGNYGNKIGHLSRDYAVEYKELLQLLESRGLVATCSAKMFGGKGDKQNVGVWLDIEPVDVLLARFASDDEAQPDGSPLTQKVVQSQVRRSVRRAGLGKSGVHRLRHTFCSHLAMKGAPARAIQEIAGHQDLGTTQRYMHLSPAAIDSAIRLLDSPGILPSRGNMVATASTEEANSFR